VVTHWVWSLWGAHMPSEHCTGKYQFCISNIHPSTGQYASNGFLTSVASSRLDATINTHHTNTNYTQKMVAVFRVQNIHRESHRTDWSHESETKSVTVWTYLELQHHVPEVTRGFHQRSVEWHYEAHCLLLVHYRRQILQCDNGTSPWWPSPWQQIRKCHHHHHLY